MDAFNTNNYTDQGGEITNIRGTLNIFGTLNIMDGAEVNGLSRSNALVGLEDVDAASMDRIREAVNYLIEILRESGVTFPD